MTIDKFLSFWSQYNTLIIEGLVALIILLSLFVGYRGFFGKKEAGSGDLGGGLDAVQLEKTLQKILENQSKVNAATHAESATEHADLHHDDKPSAASAGAGPEVAAEMAQLKATIAESRKKTEALQIKVKEAEDKAAALAASAGSAPAADAGSGMSEQEKEDLAGKIRDLEARLAEYEIISEDIADLSRYREENDELRKELDNMKISAASAPAPVAAVAPIEMPPVEEAPAQAEIEVPVAEAAEPSPNADLIDDELMKEFAAAVEGQQNKTLENVAEKAGAGTEKAQNIDEDATKLMSEFENFVAKKS